MVGDKIKKMFNVDKNLRKFEIIFQKLVFGEKIKKKSK